MAKSADKPLGIVGAIVFILGVYFVLNGAFVYGVAAAAIGIGLMYEAFKKYL